MAYNRPNYEQVTRSDPSNSFHEMRRFLMSLGIETRIGTFSSIPLPEELIKDPRNSANADNLFCVDNAFVFELRRIFETDAGPLNTNVFMCRVFFDKHQDASTFHMQIAANHKGGGTLEINQIYHDTILHLFQNDSGWSTQANNTKIAVAEKSFDSLQQFKTEFMALYAILKKHDVLNNHSLPNQM